MKVGRIKTEWASLFLAPNGTTVVCAESEKLPNCIFFESLGQLSHAIRSRKIFVKRWAIAVPRSLCILKEIALPASDLDEAYKMVEFEMPSLVPVLPDEIVYGCTLLAQQDNLMNVLVCILKQDLLNQHLKQYKDIGIEPQKVVLESLALQNWFSVTSGLVSGLGISICANKQHCYMLTCIDGHFREIKELTLFSEDIIVSSKKIAQEIMFQYRQFLSSLEKEAKIAIVGIEKYAYEIKNLLRSNFQNFASCKIDIVISPKIAYYNDVEYIASDSDDSCFYEAIVATGLLKLAVKSKLPYSNLLPRQHIKKAHQKILVFNYLLTSVLFVILLLLLWLSLTAMNWRIEQQAKKIRLQITPLENIASSVDSKRQRVQAIQRQLANRGQISRLFRELYNYTPKTISISELKLNLGMSEAIIDIKGQANMLSDAFEYTEAIGKSELLSEIHIANAQQVPRPGGSIVEFKANCLIKNH